MVEYKNFTNECGIYCFTNKINGKCYVGQAINLKNRLRSHYATFKKQNVPNMILYIAVAKHGKENFDLEILEYLDPTLDKIELKKLLDEKEKFYIQKKNSYAPNGYNQTLGGDGGVLGYKMTDEQKEKIKIAIKKNNKRFKKKCCAVKLGEYKYYVDLTYEEAAAKSGVSACTVSQICNSTRNKVKSKGWVFAFDEYTLWNRVADIWRSNYKASNNVGLNGTKVYELNDSGDVIKVYYSKKDLAEELKLSTKQICRKLNDTDKHIIDGRIFQATYKRKTPALSDEHKQKLKNSAHKKKVAQYKISGLVREFDSLKDAYEYTGIDQSSIRACCNGKRYRAGGYIWKWL